MQNEEAITIKELYPGLPDEQIKEAEENLERYLQLVVRVYERIAEDPEGLTMFREVQQLDRSNTPDAETPVPAEFS